MVQDCGPVVAARAHVRALRSGVRGEDAKKRADTSEGRKPGLGSKRARTKKEKENERERER